MNIRTYLLPLAIYQDCALAIVCLFLGSSCASGPLTKRQEVYQYQHNVVLKKTMENKLVTNDTFFISVENIGRDSLSPLHYESPIRIALKDMGFVCVSVREKAQFSVECKFYQALGKPVMGRHFDLHWRYLKMINIKVIDVGSEQLLGEIEYTRPLFSYHPSHITEFMVDKLFEDSLAEPTNSIPEH